MKDELISVDPSLSLAEQAVGYVLRRVQVDADLRWHMVGTEAYHRLCLADAARLDADVEQVKALWATPPDRLKAVQPRLPEALRTIDKLERRLGFAEDNRVEAAERAGIVRAAMDLCPACQGIPVSAISRCVMCRKLQVLL